jgi:hypothetical protein
MRGQRNQSRARFPLAAHLFLREGERIDCFFECAAWASEIRNMEPRKCDALPGNTVGYLRAAIDAYRAGIPFTLFGWG